jgi:biotin carboxylase
VSGELFVVGGAVMCLAYAARESTRDVDALFRPASKVRAAAARIAARAGVDANWLNDGVKGFLSENAAFNSFLELSHLRVMVAQPEYMLAMKCLSMRIGEEFHDEDDVRYLLRHLGVESYEAALEIIGRFYPVERFPQKTLYALEELTAKRGKQP